MVRLGVFQISRHIVRDMVSRPKVLFLLEGFAETVIESQVLANVRLIQDQNIASYEIWTFTFPNAKFKISQQRLADAQDLAQASIKLVSSIRPWTPLAYILNVFLLGIRLFPIRHNYTHIHARTDYVAAVAGPVARLYRIKLIWDCRGDAPAEVEEDLLSRWTNWPLFIYLRVTEIRFYTWLAGLFSSAAIFVTEELQDVRKFKNQKKESEIIPCAAHEEFFFFDKILREKTRQQLGYSRANTVFVYSGSLARYQCFPEVTKLFVSLSEINPNYRLLVLTPFKAAALQALKSLSRDKYEIKTCTLLQINAFLNAADIGFLIREPMKTNWVASPTKFAEYVLTGLQILTTDAIPYVYRAALEGEALIKNPRDISLCTTEERTALARRFSDSLGRKNFIENYRRLYEV